MAYLVSGNPSEAEDIMQESFVKCYLHIGELRKVEGFQTWLFQILYRTAFQIIKKQKREIPNEEILLKSEKADRITVLDRIVQTEAQREISNAVQELNVKQKAVVILYYYNEVSTREIAAILSCSEGTVKSRLFHARKRLKKTLSELQEGGIVYDENEGRYFS